MITGSVIAGKGDAGLIVWTLLPGILNVIVSVPGVLLAHTIASRSEPVPESLVFVTTVHGGKVTLALNSDVLPFASVAVATSMSPPTISAAGVNVNVLLAVAPVA